MRPFAPKSGVDRSKTRSSWAEKTETDPGVGQTTPRLLLLVGVVLDRDCPTAQIHARIWSDAVVILLKHYAGHSLIVLKKWYFRRFCLTKGARCLTSTV